MSKDIDYVALGARIRTAREKSNLTQEKLAKICSLSCAHIGHIERGTRVPSLETICKISSALNVSIDSLLLDNFTDSKYFNHLSAMLKGKDKKKLNQFISTVNSMAEKIDELW